ncbi:hypothetical protein DH2020_028342 [Rehmannia glutinosa]|uniref:Uncharacterized protein n=1 Tax=Rehmannia glutinosa TaxID=99300 RepID=A0ABR0VRM4_REHGL
MLTVATLLDVFHGGRMYYTSYKRPRCFSDKQDVYAFGTIFLQFDFEKSLPKEDRQNGAPCRVVWAWESFYADDDSETEVKNPSFPLSQSLVAESDYDPADGHKITMLAMECTDNDVSVVCTPHHEASCHIAVLIYVVFHVEMSLSKLS